MFINFYKNKNYKIYWELSKPDITLLVIITAFFGYYAGIISTDANNQIIWKDVIYLIVGVEPLPKTTSPSDGGCTIRLPFASVSSSRLYVKS